MSETATRILLAFVIVGGIVLVAGTIVLIWLLTTGTQGGSARGMDRPAALQLDAGERIVSMARGPDDLVLLLERSDRRQVLRTIDPASGALLHELPVVQAP